MPDSCRHLLRVTSVSAGLPIVYETCARCGSILRWAAYENTPPPTTVVNNLLDEMGLQ